MSVVVADLVARVRSEGVQETATQVRAIGQEAQTAARALQIMADAASKASPGQGSPSQILEFFQRANVQPTTAAIAQARSEMERVAAAATQAVAPTQAAARAARDHADATANGARAAQNVADGWKMSESSLVRFGAGLAGIGLGFSLVAGAARLIHDAVDGIITGQIEWERSLKNLSGLYGQTGAQAAALANAQANLPGVLGTQQEFAQAAINASALRLRYGLSQEDIGQMTTAGGRVAYALGLTNEAQRAQLQAQLLAAVETGAPLPPSLGIHVDPEALARRLGTPGAQTLQAYTPQEVIQARQAIVTGDANRFADRAAANQRAALDAATAAEKAAERARSNMLATLEGGAFGNNPIAAGAESGILGGGFGLPRGVAGYPNRGPSSLQYGGLAALQGNAEESLRGVVNSQLAYAQALADSSKAQDDSRRTLENLSKSVDAAGARLLGFFGSLEDQTSIGHGDILAQAQASVTARARSAIPLAGVGAAEINALAMGDTWQAAWQNFVASQAQGPQENVIQRNLQQQADTSRFRTLAPDRQDARVIAANAAQRALDQAASTAPVFQGQREAQSRAAQADLAAADTQSKLDAISLTQRERYVQLMRDTVDLRKLDVQHQQAGLAATMNVIRAQQAAAPAAQTASAAQFQSNLANAISLQRTSRLLQGKDVSDLPSFDELIQMNLRGQFAAAEAAPGVVQGARGIEVAGQAATSAGLAGALTSGQIRSAELANDLKNLGDLPTQTALELELVQNNRDQLSVQTELREYMKALVYIMTNQPSRSAPADGDDRIGDALRQSGGPR